MLHHYPHHRPCNLDPGHHKCSKIYKSRGKRKIPIGLDPGAKVHSCKRQVSTRPRKHENQPLLRLTSADFSKSLFYIGAGYDIEPLLRFTHMTDTFIYVNLFLSRHEVCRWYELQFAWHPDLDLVDRQIYDDFDETRHYDLHPDYLDHLMRPMFIDRKELEQYLNAFEQARKIHQWAIVYTLVRRSTGRVITLYYLTAEGLASYIALSHNGQYAPRILTTIRTNVLEQPRGIMNRFFAQKEIVYPDLWIRGFMPEPPVEIDVFGKMSRREENDVLCAEGLFQIPAMSFNHKWTCGNFEDWDSTNVRHCKGFVTKKKAKQVQRKYRDVVDLDGHGRHRLLFQDITAQSRHFAPHDLVVAPRRIIEQMDKTRFYSISWESILTCRFDHKAHRTVYPTVQEQLDLAWKAIQAHNLAQDATIHLIPYCLEDEGKIYRQGICHWSLPTVTYINGLMDFIDLRTKREEEDAAC